MAIGVGIKTIEFKNSKLIIIDQRRLPSKLVYKKLSNIEQVYDAIKTLSVRGAPAIGVAAAYGLYIGINTVKKKKAFFSRLKKCANFLKSARPTAVNLSWALERMRGVVLKNKTKPLNLLKELLLDEAAKIQKEDERMCEAMGAFGATLIKDKDSILTHCNAGALATAGIGTALAAIYAAKAQSKKIKVYADETRPLLQGSRLTAWELYKSGVDITLICDNMAASLMKAGKVDKVIVGADRIAANGDFANKIGTYNLAVLAKAHKIPFFTIAPSSTFDFSLKTGKAIPIEQRNPDEIRKINGNYITPKQVKVYNPAFDVTPNSLVTAIVTEKGVFRKPYSISLKSLKGLKG